MEIPHVTGNLKLYPAGPAYGTIVNSSTTASAYGAWTQIVASTSTDIYLYAVGVRVSTPDYSQISIGTGASGSEVERAVTKFVNYFTDGTTPTIFGYTEFQTPLFIASGTRIAARSADMETQARAHVVTLYYFEAGSLVNRMYDEVRNPRGAVVSDVSNSATTFKTNLTETVNDYWKDAFLKFTSGALINQVKSITAYNGSTKFVTVSGGFTSTPAAGAEFEIINQ